MLEEDGQIEDSESQKVTLVGFVMLQLKYKYFFCLVSS